VSGEGTVNVGETSVPMLGQWGLIALGVVLASLLAFVIHRRLFRPGLASIGQAL